MLFCKKQNVNLKFCSYYKYTNYDKKAIISLIPPNHIEENRIFVSAFHLLNDLYTNKIGITRLIFFLYFI